MGLILRRGRRTFYLTKQPKQRGTGACIPAPALQNALVQNQTTSDSWQQLLEMPRKSWWARLPFGVRMAAGASALLLAVGGGAIGVATLVMGGDGGGDRGGDRARWAPAVAAAGQPATTSPNADLPPRRGVTPGQDPSLLGEQLPPPVEGGGARPADAPGARTPAGHARRGSAVVPAMPDRPGAPAGPP